MQIEICRDDKCFPFLFVDNWYNSEEEDLIWKELDFYTNSYSFARSEDDPSSASLADGSSKANFFRLSLDKVYTQFGVERSAILRAKTKIISSEMKDAIKKTTPVHRIFLGTNADSTLVNYYEDGEDYKPHFDTSVMSVIIWFHKSPKAYDGGDFVFTDSGIKVESNHNRLVMFPCFYEHAAEPVILKDSSRLSGLGRYSIVHFYYNI
jgi:hypothetical protein